MSKVPSPGGSDAGGRRGLPCRGAAPLPTMVGDVRLHGGPFMPLVHYATELRIATLTLDDPPANAYTHEMMKELDAAIVRARFDAEVDAIVLTGRGERFFCAGANVEMLAKADATWKYWFCLHANETLLRLEHT